MTERYMSRIKERINFYYSRIKAGRLKAMRLQAKWIYGYAKHYFWQMMLWIHLPCEFGITILFSVEIINIAEISMLFVING